MLLALLDFYLALEFKGFSQWEPRTKAIACIVGGVLALVFSITFVRKVGIIAIAVPAVIIGAIFAMQKNQGCLDKAGDVQEEGTYQKGKAKPAGTTTPAK